MSLEQIGKVRAFKSRLASLYQGLTGDNSKNGIAERAEYLKYDHAFREEVYSGYSLLNEDDEAVECAERTLNYGDNHELLGVINLIAIGINREMGSEDDNWIW